MSFRPPWDHYKPQDLFYGTQRGRGSLIEYIRSVVATSLHWPHYVDTFTLLRSQGQSPPPPTGRWRYIVYDANFIESLLSHEKYKSIVGHDYRSSLPGAAGMLLHQSVMRRQSKGMLFHVVQRTNWTIHFSLDSLSIENEISKGRDDPRNFFHGKYDPLGKAPLGMPAALKTRSITGSELRWIFRHRHDARVQQQIQFWKKVGQEKYRRCRTTMRISCLSGRTDTEMCSNRVHRRGSILDRQRTSRPPSLCMKANWAERSLNRDSGSPRPR